MSIRSLWIGTLAAVAALGAVSSANAVTVTPDAVPNINVVSVFNSTLYIKDTQTIPSEVPPVSFAEFFTFSNGTGGDTFFAFEVNTTQPDGDPIGIANLKFEFTNGGNTETFSNITDGAGMLSAANREFVTTLLLAGNTVLEVTGISISSFPPPNGGSYDFTASVVPLPPALLLFGTALGGMGWLSRRRKASATA